MLRAVFALFAAFWVALAGAQELQPMPSLKTRVTDLTATLSVEESARIQARLKAFEQEKGAQIAVLIVPTTQPEAIEQYSIRVAEKWKLGRKGVDDGVLLLVAKQDRKLRIEVGYGLEGALNDATAKRIIAETITPQFKQGQFAAGIEAGVERTTGVVGGEALPEPASTGASGEVMDDNAPGYAVGGLIAVIVLSGLLRAMFGRFLGAVASGGIAGGIAMFLLSSLAFALFFGAIAFIIVLATGGGGGRSYRSSGSGWSSSSGSSWSSSSSSSSDSFSGGGGDFGGGGSSGDW